MHPLPFFSSIARENEMTSVEINKKDRQDRHRREKYYTVYFRSKNRNLWKRIIVISACCNIKKMTRENQFFCIILCLSARGKQKYCLL